MQCLYTQKRNTTKRKNPTPKLLSRNRSFRSQQVAPGGSTLSPLEKRSTDSFSQAAQLPSNPSSSEDALSSSGANRMWLTGKALPHPASFSCKINPPRFGKADHQPTPMQQAGSCSTSPTGVWSGEPGSLSRNTAESPGCWYNEADPSLSTKTPKFVHEPQLRPHQVLGGLADTAQQSHMSKGAKQRQLLIPTHTLCTGTHGTSPGC